MHNYFSTLWVIAMSRTAKTYENLLFCVSLRKSQDHLHTEMMCDL